MNAVGLAAFWVGAILLLGAMVWRLRRHVGARNPGPELGFVLLGLLSIGAWTTQGQAPGFRLELLTISRPWLSVAALLGLYGVLWKALSSKRYQGIQGQFADGFFCLAYVLLVLAAMDLHWSKAREGLTVVVVLDKSLSVDRASDGPQQVDRALADIRRSMTPKDRLGTVVFGSDAATAELPRGFKEAPIRQEVPVDRGGTHIEAGIRQAFIAAPLDGATRLLLISDGAATRGDALRAARAARAASVPIDVLALRVPAQASLELREVMAPQQARQGENIEVRAVVRAPHDMRAELSWQLGNEPVQRSQVQLQAGEQVLFKSIEANASGLLPIRLRVKQIGGTAGSLSTSSSELRRFIEVSGSAKALVIDGEGPSHTRFLCASLERNGMECEPAQPMRLNMPLVDLARYDLVVLSDVSAHSFESQTLDQLKHYVEDAGGGLLLVGGRNSFGPGGYSQTPVERLAPVHFDIKHKRRRLRLNQVIAIDTSGSMAMMVDNKSKLQLANEGAVRSASLMAKQDVLGVLHVDTHANWSVALQPLEHRSGIENAIRQAAVGGGGIYVDAALQAAYGGLQSYPDGLRHVLLFADGGDAERLLPTTYHLAKVARSKGTTTSCVALGKGKDVPALQRLAKLGGGRFYLVEDAKRLPTIFAQETFIASRAALHEDAFVPRIVSRHAVTQGLGSAKAPPLGGYVITIPKSRARVLMRGPDDDPVLATWSTGLGRCAAFTSDLKGGWGKRWIQWPQASAFFAQLAQHTARRPRDSGVTLQAHSRGGHIHLDATVVDAAGRPFSFRQLNGTVLGPHGYRAQVALKATAPGRYRARTTATAPGAYVVTVGDDKSRRRLVSVGVGVERNEELQKGGSDLAHLRSIAELSGGRMIEQATDLFRQPRNNREQPQPLRPWLFGLTGLLLVAMVALRRLPLHAYRTRVQQRLLRLAKDQELKHPTTNRVRSLVARRRARHPSGSTKSSPAQPEKAATAPDNPVPNASMTLAEGASQAPKQPGESSIPAAAAGPGEENVTQPAKSAAQILVERQRKRR